MNSRKIVHSASWLLFLGLTPVVTFAAPAVITYTFEHHILSIRPAAHPEWRAPKRIWEYRGVIAEPPAQLKTCGKNDGDGWLANRSPPWADGGWSSRMETDWNEDAIAQTIAKEVSAKLNREAGSVVIRKTVTGSTVFEGRGLPGRIVNEKIAAVLTKEALEKDIATVALPMEISAPAITVEDQELVSLGIREVVMVGESVFAGSPVNRRHNIGVGLARFNGHLIPKGSVFSFVETLGHVGPKEGYRKELVIQGDTTLPDYGGGLCQVSTTSYRGPWEYGLPILQRKNHSYAVSYYSPQGTDATIYPPNVDMKFLNDTPGALLIQTFTDSMDRAYFVYYGTKDDRITKVYGPFITGRSRAPSAERTVYTTEIPPGAKRKAGDKHDGLTAVWYREIQRPGTGAVLERFVSIYETRAFTWQVGVTPEEMDRPTGPEDNEMPSWLPSKP